MRTGEVGIFRQPVCPFFFVAEYSSNNSVRLKKHSAALQEPPTSATNGTLHEIQEVVGHGSSLDSGRRGHRLGHQNKPIRRSGCNSVAPSTGIEFFG